MLSSQNESSCWLFAVSHTLFSFRSRVSWTRLALESQEVQGEKTLVVLLLQHLLRYFSFTSYFLYMLSWTVLWLERRSKLPLVEADGKQRFLWFPKNKKKKKVFGWSEALSALVSSCWLRCSFNYFKLTSFNQNISSYLNLTPRRHVL